MKTRTATADAAADRIAGAIADGLGIGGDLSDVSARVYNLFVTALPPGVTVAADPDAIADAAETIGSDLRRALDALVRTAYREIVAGLGDR